MNKETNQQPITVVVATDNFYAILLSALLKSIEQNHVSEEPIHVHVINDGISAKNISRITQTVSPDLFTFSWHKVADVVPKGFKFPRDVSALPVTMYLRLFGPCLVPAETKKLLYLDVDMIMLKDISSLWNVQLGEKIVAAVQDRCLTMRSGWGGVANYQALGLRADDPYFNSGLLLIDPAKWRELDVASKVIKVVSENTKFAKWPDQYGLNVVLANRWLMLDPNWNAFVDQLYDDPFLLHYLNIKPIFKSYNSEPTYFDIFHFYLKQTPFRNFKVIGHSHLLFRKVANKINKKLVKFSIS